MNFIMLTFIIFTNIKFSRYYTHINTRAEMSKVGLDQNPPRIENFRFSFRLEKFLKKIFWPSTELNH